MWQACRHGTTTTSAGALALRGVTEMFRGTTIGVRTSFAGCYPSKRRRCSGRKAPPGGGCPSLKRGISAYKTEA
jgi:hypothetical protein